MERYKLSLIHISDKGLMSRLYRSLLQIHIYTTEIIYRESHLFKEKEQIVYLNLKYISSKPQSDNTFHLMDSYYQKYTNRKTKQARFHVHKDRGKLDLLGIVGKIIKLCCHHRK